MVVVEEEEAMGDKSEDESPSYTRPLTPIWIGG